MQEKMKKEGSGVKSRKDDEEDILWFPYTSREREKKKQVWLRSDFSRIYFSDIIKRHHHLPNPAAAAEE